MAYRIILPAEQPDQETYGQQAKRIATGAGFSALKGIESLLTAPATLTGQQFTPTLPSQGLQQSLGITSEYLQPRSTPEHFIQRFSQFAPLAATGGLPALGRTALGSAVATGLGSLGAPEAVQDIAQLGTEIGAGLFKRGAKAPTLGATQKAEYAAQRATVNPKVMASAQTVKNALNEVGEHLSTETSGKIKNKISHALQTVESNITKGKLNPQKAVDLRKSLYQLTNELGSYASVKYIDPLTKGLNTFFAEYGATNPEFYKHLSSGDKLTQIKHSLSYAERYLDKYADYLPKYKGIRVGAKLAIKGAGKLEKTAKSLYHNPRTRNFLFDAIEAASTDNPQLFFKNINNILPKEERLPADIFNKPRYRIVLPEQ